MSWIGTDDCRIEKIMAVSKGLHSGKTGLRRTEQGRAVDCFCFKLSGASLHTSAQDSVLCEKDTLLFIPRGIRYAVESVEEGPSIVVDFLFSHGIVPPRRLKFFHPEDPLAMRRLFEEMVLLSAGVHPGDTYALLARLYQVMAMTENPSSGGADEGRKVSKIEPALALIRKRLSDSGLSEIQLAEACGYSVGYFRRIFTEVTGFPPVRFVAEKRMERAAAMLGSGFLTVTEIAEQTGFTSVSYFSTAFTRRYGCSPSLWLLRSREREVQNGGLLP